MESALAPPGRILDLTRDLQQAARLGADPGVVDALLGEALEALGSLVPYELATIMELEGRELRVRVARGQLAGPAVRAHRLSLESFPSLREVLERGRARAFLEHDHGAGDGDPFDGVLDFPHGHACMVVPLKVDEHHLGVMTLDHSHCPSYDPGVVALADVVGKLLALAMNYGEQSEALTRLVGQLETRNRVLRERVGPVVDAGARMLQAQSPLMRQVVALARQVAATDTPVLIRGETGTGKEVMANALHGWSSRARQSLISLNCAALPPNLIESELFGHVKGAFSGATATRVGRFQAANGGTLLLDEVGEIPLDLQAKLLRALQEGCFEPVGSDRTVRVDVRILAATNKDLQAAVAAREFREDLYYRLAVFPLHLPPLRARPEDVAPLARSALEDLHRRSGRGPWRLDPAAIAWLEAQPWPGNVRELVNALERATVLARGEVLGVELFQAPATGDLPRPGPGPGAGPEVPARALVTLEAAERGYILEVLAATGGQVAGKGGAAEILGLPASTLRSRMKKLGIAPGAKKGAG